MRKEVEVCLIYKGENPVKCKNCRTKNNRDNTCCTCCNRKLVALKTEVNQIGDVGSLSSRK